ncbi:exonuclease SbcCD subunit D C-terminal domain-containing protein [Psychroflexus planctonicus]|uniref:Nuclease SbcCD subunit D n=1 Tax=Psychroflexus planctonicus TaxID=1526575 RepID=A0ABQ1SG33_9FLAO|nr:exonuclease SbcCD subunit D C-terminal domain-containing protein [Psychroflexus planctonicus]GGE35750.1 nuclease SbcCD subunit D [Psychroflexus planctonicus]
MKILHTADWHIGKKLHKQDLSEDFELFIQWLCKEIDEQQVDVLLVSGDVFDLANPSNEAKRLYYQSILKLRNLGLQIIITGGNHDSPSMLNAPQAILNELNVQVMGSLPEKLKEVLIPIPSKNGEIELVVAAIPFLRNKDLQSAEVAKTYEERLQNLKEAIANYYTEAAEIAQTNYPEIPCIAMGHLFTHGVSTSESERDIQIGNQAGVEASQFGNYFSYVALGHIHQPQQVKAEIPIYYSGSPIQLSFSERKDEKRVLLIDTKNGFVPTSIAVPSFRKLIKLKGNLNEIQQKLANLETNNRLTHFIEIELIEKKHNPQIVFLLNNLMENFQLAGYSIVKHRIHFEEKQKGLSEVAHPDQNLDEMKAKDVFEKRIAETELNSEQKQNLMSNFEILLQEIEENQ